MTGHLKDSDASHHSFFNDSVKVKEFNFDNDNIINDAEITLHSRYPDEGFAVNDKSTALISVENGSGFIALKGSPSQSLEKGDRLLIPPKQPYYFDTSEMVIRYIATPAWKPDQARIVS